MRYIIALATFALVSCSQDMSVPAAKPEIETPKPELNLVCQVEHYGGSHTVYLSIMENNARYFIHEGNGWRYKDGLEQTEKTFVLEPKSIKDGRVTTEIDRMSGLVRTIHTSHVWGLVSDRGGYCAKIELKDMPPGRPSFTMKL